MLETLRIEGEANGTVGLRALKPLLLDSVA